MHLQFAVPCTLAFALGAALSAQEEAPATGWRPLPRLEVGGWVQTGYTSQPTAFNDTAQDRRVLLNQAWGYLEKQLAGDGEWDWGARVDVVYGADGANTDAFGNPHQSFDLGRGFSRGAQAAWAIPQLYAEVGDGTWDVKVGHFFTLHGYEVVQAPGNFFYTHAYTMNYAEPFTHTGVLGSHTAADGTTIYAGWTAGFDTGFAQASHGSNFLGGYGRKVGENVTVTQILSFGDFGQNFAPPIVAPNGALNEGSSFAVSTVIDCQLSEHVHYVLHNDVLRTGVYDATAIDHYLFWQLDAKLTAGARFEWWKSDGRSVYAATVGLNVRPHERVTIRPEYRYDWSPSGNTNAGIQRDLADDGTINGSVLRQRQSTFAIDVVIVF
ncbi:MAG: outer membrane beta-barrel protein [Planctomycetota bacterium]